MFVWLVVGLGFFVCFVLVLWFYEVQIGYKSENQKVFTADRQLAIPVATGQDICVTISSSMVT